MNAPSMVISVTLKRGLIPSGSAVLFASVTSSAMRCFDGVLDGDAVDGEWRGLYSHPDDESGLRA